MEKYNKKAHQLIVDICNKPRTMNDEIFDDIEKLALVHPNEFKLVHCSNETFSSSLALICKFSDQYTKIMFFDQHNNDVVEMNFSNIRLDSLIDSLNQLKGISRSINKL